MPLKGKRSLKETWLYSHIRDLPAHLASCLNNASTYYRRLGEATASADQRRELLERALTAIKEATGVDCRLDLPTNLAMDLANQANVLTALAQLAEAPPTALGVGEDEGRRLRVRAAESIDKAVALFEATGQNVWLAEAYRLGVATHLPLTDKRPESLARVREYAAKAAPLLRAHGRQAGEKDE